MMSRVFTARTLAAMLLAAATLPAPPASAGLGGLVIQERQNTAATDQQNVQLLRMNVIGALRQHRGAFREVPWTAVTTANAGDAQLVTSRGTEQYDITIHIAATLRYQPLYPSTYNWPLHLNGATWPSKPQVYFFYPEGASGTASNSGSDSTGTSDSYAYPAVFAWGCLYSTKNPANRWKNMYGSVKPAISSASARSYVTSSATGIWRPIIGWSTTPASNGASAGGAANAVVDPDSLRNGGAQYPDSVVGWMVMRHANDPAPLFFCYAGAGGLSDRWAIQTVLALADSFTSRTVPGGALFPNRPGVTKKRAFAVRGVNLTSKPVGSIELTHGGGVNCPDGAVADSCDRANYGTGLSMVDALGARWTAYAEPHTDSLYSARGSASLAYLDNLTRVRVGMMAVSGTFSASTSRAAGAGLCRDPFGINNTRTALPVGQTEYPPNCAADSGSIFCNIENGWTALETRFPGKVDYSILPALYDWSPRQWTRAGNGGLPRADALAAIYCKGKTRAILYNPTATNSNVGLSYSTGGSISTYATTPAGWEIGERYLQVSWAGERLGSIKLLGARDEPAAPLWRWKQESHAGLNMEYLAGADLGKFYLIDASSYYHHTFNVATSVFVVPAVSLGGPYAGPWPQRPGYHAIASLVRGSNVANEHACSWPDGAKKVFNDWVWVSDLEPFSGGLR